MLDLRDYGFTPARGADLDNEAGEPARVVNELRGAYRVITIGGERDAELTGRLRYQADDRSELPTVGDWVQAIVPSDGPTIVRRVLPRTSLLARKETGTKTTAQPIAANVDTVLIVTALDRDFNPRRLERQLALVRGSGARPVLILNKVDACDDPEPALTTTRALAGDAPYHPLSAWTGRGVEALAEHLRPTTTVALIGMSGVGKSTLVNRLLGEQRLATGAIRASDDRGRHTTTSRQLLRIPCGALLVDTPGMRQFGLWEENVDEAGFDDIAALAERCRFRNCAHEDEPGCAVHAAVARGELDPARLSSHHKLTREQRWLVARLDARQRAATKRKWKQVTKAMRQVPGRR